MLLRKQTSLTVSELVLSFRRLSDLCSYLFAHVGP